MTAGIVPRKYKAVLIMKKPLSLSFLLFLFTGCSSLNASLADPATNLETLEQVQIIFRHGLRSPEKPYPGDPYSDLRYWPQGWGALTNLGKKQQFELGKYLRQRYGPFITTAYSSKQFYAVSSDSDRTIMSLLANLAGLLPPTEQDEWNPEVPRWHPVPIRTIPRHMDTIIRSTAPCPRFDLLWNQLLRQREFLDSNAQFKDLYNRIGNYTGKSYSYPIELTTFYEALIIQQAHNLTLPAWAKEILDSDESSKFLSFAFSLVVKTEEMKRLRGGPLLREILSNMKRLVSRHNQANRVIMFSGHDITLARILDTLGIFEPPHIPDFNSVLLLELHRRANTQSTEEKDFFVQVYYRNGDGGIVQMKLNGCDEPCSLTDFQRLFGARTISEKAWENECSAGSGTELFGFFRRICKVFEWLP